MKAAIVLFIGMDPHTVAKGRRELIEQDFKVGRIRKAGGGRKPVGKNARNYLPHRRADEARYCQKRPGGANFSHRRRLALERLSPAKQAGKSDEGPIGASFLDQDNVELLSTRAGDHDGSPGGVGRLGEQSEKFIRVLEESTLHHDGDVHGWQ